MARLPLTSFGLKEIVRDLRKWAMDPDRRFEDLCSMIVGVHVRFWHAPPARLIPLLAAAGAPRIVLQQVAECLKRCKHCQGLAPPRARPMVRASLARFFNHVCQADAFVLLGAHYCLVIDELFRYKQACDIRDHSFETFRDFFLANWVRFFGPMLYLVVDQE